MMIPIPEAKGRAAEAKGAGMAAGRQDGGHGRDLVSLTSSPDRRAAHSAHKRRARVQAAVGGAAAAPADDGTNVTAWEVTGAVDYDKLCAKFGCTVITPALVERIERATGVPAHPFLKRRVFYAHRDMEQLLDRYERGEKFFLYTGALRGLLICLTSKPAVDKAGELLRACGCTCTYTAGNEGGKGLL